MARKLNTKITGIAVLVIIAATWLAGLVIYPLFPDRVASHWDASGEVNGYSSKFWGVFLMPLIMAAMSLLFFIFPRIDPSKKNIESFQEYYSLTWLFIIIFLLYVHLLTVMWNLGYIFNFTTFMIPALSVLFFIMGIVLKKTKRNWFLGIRTPWTLSNDIVWKKTHQLGGKLFKAAAIISFCGIFVQSKFSMLIALIPVVIVSVIVTVYSYFEYKKIT